MADFRIEGVVTADTTQFVRSMRRADAILDDLTRNMHELDSAIDRIDGRSVGIDVDLRGVDELWECERKIEELDGRSIRIKVKSDCDDICNPDPDSLNRSADGMDRMGNSAKGAGLSISSFLIPAIAALVVAAAPLVPVAAGGLLAIAAGATTAGVGLGAFAAFAIPTFQEVAEGLKADEEALSKMDPAIRAVVGNLKGLKDEYLGFAEALRPQVFEIMNSGIDVMRTLMESTFPIAEAFAPAINRVVQSINQGLKGDEWQAFFGYVGEEGPALFEKFSAAIGNFFTGFANLVVALDPITQMFTDGLLGMSESFRNWSQNLETNKGFQDFVAFVKESGPAVMDFFGSLIKFLWDLIEVLAPVGVDILKFTTPLLDAASAWMNANPQAAEFAVQVGLIGAALYPLAGPMTTLVTSVAALSGPVGLAVAAAGAVALIGALSLMFAEGDSANKVFEQMGNTWDKLKEVGLQIWENLQPLWDLFKSEVAPDFNRVMENMLYIWEQMAPLLIPLATVLGGAFLLALKTVSTTLVIITDLMRQIADVIAPIIDWIVEKFQWLYDKLVGHSIVPDLVDGIIKWFQKLPGAIGGLASRAVADVVGWFTGLPGRVMGSLGNLGGQLAGAGRDIIGGLIGGINDKLPDLRGLLNSVTSWIPDWKGPAETDKTLLQDAGQLIMSGLIDGIYSKQSELESVLRGVSTTIANTALAPIGGEFSATATAGGGEMPAGNIGVYIAPGGVTVHNHQPTDTGGSVNKELARLSSFGQFGG